MIYMISCFTSEVDKENLNDSEVWCKSSGKEKQKKIEH